MSDAKTKAKAEMLKKLSKIMHDDMKEGAGKELSAKKATKDSFFTKKEEPKKELTKAQQLIKAKFGDVDESEEEEEEEAHCPACEDQGCEECEEDEEESDEE